MCRHEGWQYCVAACPSEVIYHPTDHPQLCRGETPEQRLQEVQAVGESAQVVLLQRHLAKALHSSQLTQVSGLYSCRCSLERSTWLGAVLCLLMSILQSCPASAAGAAAVRHC